MVLFFMKKYFLFLLIIFIIMILITMEIFLYKKNESSVSLLYTLYTLSTNNSQTSGGNFFLSNISNKNKKKFDLGYSSKRSWGKDIQNPRFIISEDGKYIVRFGDHVIQIAEIKYLSTLAEEEPIIMIKDKRNQIIDVIISRDGSEMIYTTVQILNPEDPFSDMNKKIYWWSRETKKNTLLPDFSQDGFLSLIGIDSVRNELYLAHSTNDSLENFTVFHLQNEKEKEVISLINHGLYSPLIVSDGKVYFYSLGCELLEYNLDHKSQRVIFSTNKSTESSCGMNFLLSPDSNTILLSIVDDEDSSSKIFKINLQKTLPTNSLLLTNFSKIYLFSWSPDGRYVFMKMDNNKIGDRTISPDSFSILDLQKNKTHVFFKEISKDEEKKQNGVAMLFLGWIKNNKKLK